MFRKLIRIETEAMLRQTDDTAGVAGVSDEAWASFAGEPTLCMPSLPQRFGVCAAGVG